MGVAQVYRTSGFVLRLLAVLSLVSLFPAPVAATRTSQISASATAPTLRGRFTFPDDHPLNDMAVVGRYGYIAYGDARFEGYGLRIVDLANPGAIKIVGGYNLHPPGTTGQIPAIAVSGNYAYLAAGSEGLRVVNVTNVAAPVEVGVYPTPSGGYVSDIVVVGTTAYVAAGGAGFRIVDVANPAAPIEVGKVDAVNVSVVTVAQNMAYVGAGERLLLVDITNRSMPTQVGTFNIREDGERTGFIADVAVADGRAYLTWGNCMRVCSGGLMVVDVVQPSSPVKLGTFGEYFERPFGAIKVAGNYAYIGVDNGCWEPTRTCSGTLQIINIATPTMPMSASSVDLGSGAQGINVTNNTIVLLDRLRTNYEYRGRVSVFNYVPPLPAQGFVPLLSK